MSYMNIEIPSLTIVMPCLNEEENILAAIRGVLVALDKYGIDGELLVIDDGSTDRTRQIVLELVKVDRRIRLLSHERPWGVGATFWHGVKEARNDYVTRLPGNNENDPVDCLSYFYMAKDTDIIVPFIHNVEVRSLLRRFLSSLYRLIVNISFGMNLNHMNGPVIYNTTVLREIELKSVGFFYQAEILIKLIRKGYFYAETPHLLSHHSGGNTRTVALKSFIDMTKAYLQLMWDVHIVRKVGMTDAPLNPKSATYRRLKLFMTGDHD